jgi:methylenetetrahydrofolate dehydrogenase (NADP+)/methenyltetrahydrofolate cyclohydrolase
MTAKIIDGKEISEQILAEVASDITKLKARNVSPGLAVVLVGEDPASISYVSGKEKACARLGIMSEMHRMPATTTMDELLKAVDGLNKRPQIHGILVQSPLPNGLNEARIVEAIDPRKDVDGFHPLNIGRMMAGQDCLLPCTPAGIIEMLLRVSTPS